MADAFLSFAVQKLDDFLIQQVSLRKNLRDEVTWLRNELLFMQSFLRDAEQKQYGDQRVQQWVFEINSIANDAVAILETYSFETGKGDDDGFASRLKACAYICRKEKKFYNVAKEIQSLKQRIMDISRKRETYGITTINSNAGEGPSNQSAMVRTLRRTTSYVDDQDYIFVGLQDVVRTLLDELLKAEPRRSVVSIYGMGGLGKTTLARNLYNSPDILNSFSTRAWICVSQEAFPDGKNGSRVITTTRKEDVAERADDRVDKVVTADNIIWLWMAEGFIPRGEERMEDVGEGFLDELIKRSLVQVANTFWERVTECRVHDLLHDPATQKALEVNFFDIYDPRSHSISYLCIRHAIHSQGERSVFQHLYVLYLDMHVGNMSIVPDAIGSLYHLKFLSLRGICDVPSSIGNLKNLQTLVVDAGGYACQLPRETWKDVDPVDLVNLRELSMEYISDSYSLNNISRLKKLSTLTLDSVGGQSFPSLEFVNCCEKLQKLSLEGRIEKLPHLFPNSITMMVLRFSILTEDPMPILGMLPNLRNLDLVRAYEGKEIKCSDNSFSQLEFLILYDLENLERWHSGTSAMPLIKGLGIHDCPNLKEIPERMKDVELLKRNYTW
ncbi:hypothetical protein KY284_019730 [Solanum tuberosum]|nr:hypothetical protein KY284_019730 [Solanum tuberosum]